ncbi:Ig-like domain-containing protein [Nocardioides speluncae]|uniref:Ig-like domain-containing protein n=1 Tax=Nocardioides speluncae TaxID=2670337 RepID=UPI000D698C40|nr:Ig-like domain-containing protein [Nocardioides speluncae]
MSLGAFVRRHRAAIASQVALALAAGGVVAYAVAADGYQAHETQLNDGGIWVTNSRDGFYGRLNKPIGQLDGAVFAQLDATLDIVQDGAAVVAVNQSDGLIAPIDPASVTHPEDEQAGIPSSAIVALAGGTLATADPVSGEVWAQRMDTVLGTPTVSALDTEAQPIAKTGKQTAMTVSQSGEVIAISAADDEITRIPVSGDALGKASEDDLGIDVGEQVQVTAVGDRAVVLDTETGALQVIGGAKAELPPGSALQQAGPETDDVLVGTPDGLIAVNLDDGGTRQLADGVQGRPTPPVRLGACEYGAWSGGEGAVATACEGQETNVANLNAATSDLVFRVNRGEILLNDRATGAVWNIDSDEPTRMDNWDAFKQKVKEDDKDQENEKEDKGDRRPPKAKDDDLGARPGRTTILHPLDNDTAPDGRLLAIRSVQDVTGDGKVTISPDGQSIQLQMPGNAKGTTSFEYYIDDGRASVSAHATVNVSTRLSTSNASPHLREGFEEDQVWTVPAGGTLDLPVLPDWRDKEDGDPVSLVSAEAKNAGSGADARVTASGRVRFTAPQKGGISKVEYGVTDGIGEPIINELTFRVQDKKDRTAIAATAEPDVISGEVGKPITIRPLGNDLPGSDPITPNAALSLAGKITETAGATTKTDLVEGEITFRSDRAKTFFLDYDAAYGNAPFSRGKIRIDVRAPQQEPPVAVPDTLTLYGQSPSLVDVLANDVDPSGDMLVVQRAEAATPNQVDVAVVDGRWLRIAARQGALTPNPMLVRYTISSGSRGGVQGQVVVNQRPAPTDNTPVTETDRVTVRAGSTASVPVLDNDFSPSGDPLTLVSHVAEEGSGRLTVQVPGDRKAPTGEAFVAGKFIRYVAPSGLKDPQRFVVRYLATNADGDTAPGRMEVTVMPLGRNEPPEPPVLEGRVVSGDTVKLKVPAAEVDPDGDAVTLLGIGSAPRLGRLVKFGANSVRYQAYPGSAGTDEFTYQVTDPYGGVALGTVRVAVVTPGAPQPPLAVPDVLTVEPGRTATVDVLANDLLAAGDRATVELVDPPDGVSLESDTGPVVIQAPDKADGRNVEVVYRLGNGIDASQGTITLRTAKPYNNPPVVFDAFGPRDEGDTVSVDVLDTAYDPDGPSDELKVAEVFAPQGVTANVEGSRISVARGKQPIVVPFRVEDADGGVATASLFVPATASGPPYTKSGAAIEVEPGGSVTAKVSDLVTNPVGGPVILTLKNRIWASPQSSLTAVVTGEDSFKVTAAKGYEGPGAVTFEVTTGSSVDDAKGRRAVLAVPVQVGETAPILRCPTEPVEIAQGESVDLDIAALCHVWTADPDDADSLKFAADWEKPGSGLNIIQPEGAVIEVAAAGSAKPGTQGTLKVQSSGSEPGLIRFTVIKTPPPSLTPIKIADMKSGESRTIDLARYLRAGVEDPDPTVITAEQVTGLDVQIEKSGSEVTLTTSDKVDGKAEFRIVMSDVSGNPGPERRVEGRINLAILDAPDKPTPPVPGDTVRSKEVSLNWRAPAANGAPIDSYELKASDGTTRKCGSTSCDFTGLTNGKPYSFQVRAHNAVGWSDWSGASAKATPDTRPGIVGPIEQVRVGDRTVTFRWTKPTTEASAVKHYWVSWAGSTAKKVRGTQYTATGLDNNKKYTFSVQAENNFDVGERRISAPMQSVGTPGTPAAPTITDQQTAGDNGAVTLDWPAVDPNGPAPASYTVFRNDQALASCTNITVTTCDNSGIKYDGTTYSYKVKVTNGGNKSATGPASTWKATGTPAEWGDWSVFPTGQDNAGQATFSAPASRGSSSTVHLLINGGRSGQSWQASPNGQSFADQPVRMPADGSDYQVSLQVCNENERCTTSGTKNLRTFGPVGIGSVQKSEGQTEASCTWPVNPNGLVVTVDFGGRAENIGPGDGTVNVRRSVSGSSQRLNCDLTVTTEGNQRPVERREGGEVTTPPPNPKVSISRGAKCNDATSAPDCGGSTPCNHPSCGHVRISSSDVPSSNMSCELRSEEDTGGWGNGTFNANTTYDTPRYYGYPGNWIEITCSAGGQTFKSPRINWPTS